MFHPNLQVLPDSTWVVASEIRRGLVEKPDLVMPFERFENGRNENPVIVFFCDLSLAGERNNIVGKVLQNLDHGTSSVSCLLITNFRRHRTHTARAFAG